MNRYMYRVASAVSTAARVSVAWFWASLIGSIAGIELAARAAGMHASGLAFNEGASPTGMNLGNSPQASSVIHYNNKFTKNLKANTPAQRVCSRREMPAQAGVKYRDFMYQTLAANTTATAEGTVGSSITVATSYTDYTLGQWSDYINFSDLVLLTTIDPMVENVERELAYRLGRTIQKLTIAQLDFSRTVDAKVGEQDAPNAATSMSKNTAVEAAGSLHGLNVNPLEGGHWGCLIHPWFTTDLMVNGETNGYTDILKRTPEGQMALKELPSPGGEEATVLQYSGINFFETTELTVTANFKGSGAAAVRTYVVGEDGLIAVRIERPGKTSIGDGRHQNLKLWRGRYAAGSAFDPANVIGGGCSYNVVGTWGLPPDTTMRVRAYDFVPQNT
jgi:N4-gp56 family major capsid protein